MQPPTLSALADTHDKEQHCLEHRKGRETLTPAKKPATALLPQETAKAERKPPQVSLPGASVFESPRTGKNKGVCDGLANVYKLFRIHPCESQINNLPGRATHEERPRVSLARHPFGLSLYSSVTS